MCRRQSEFELTVRVTQVMIIRSRVHDFNNTVKCVIFLLKIIH